MPWASRATAAAALAAASLCLQDTTAAARTATVDEVQPSERDRTRAAWINGPTHSGKIGGNWPTFSDDDAGSTSTACTTFDDEFTGYQSNSRYCQNSSPELDDNAHLLLASGNLGLVVDAGGLSDSVDAGPRSLFPKLGSTASLPSNSSVRELYDGLPMASANFTLTTDCDDGRGDVFVLGTTGSNKQPFLQTGLVRQGHAVTQVTLTSLVWHHADEGNLFGPCADFESQLDPQEQNCHSDYVDVGASQYHCPTDYPSCVPNPGSWGRCYSVCTAANQPPELWIELSVWGDSIALELAWEDAYNLTSVFGASCNASVAIEIVSPSIEGGAASASVTLEHGATAGDRVSLFLQSVGADGTIVPGTDTTTAAKQVQVSTSTAGATVVTREATRDVVVEIPTSTAKCGYNLNCAQTGIMLVDITAENTHLSQERTLRLSFSRGFETRVASLSQSSPSAEITGLNLQLWDTATMQPSGIPVQISKNWHSGNYAAYWAGFDGTWWTANSFLRIPADSTVSLTLVINYELYGGVPAWSHAQLSIVGYSDRWLWEEAALGSGGENICFDPLGTHTRAFITDVRPKLFDGAWKENVGGGDFLMLFDDVGALQYLKELDPQLHASGPCLSNASYTSMTRDGSLHSSVQISGTRTDDLVRVFMRVKIEVLKDVNFTRFVFFQAGSETYNYRAYYDDMVFGYGSTKIGTVLRECSGGTNRRPEYMYGVAGPTRATMSGSAPWWVSMGNNEDTVTMDTSAMVVGDEGVIIRSFSGQLGGEAQDAPSYSVLCDKLELGVPAGLRFLKQGDFVDLSLEYIILPRVGDEFDLALQNSGSRTLSEKLAGLESWQRVRAQAEGGELVVTALRDADVQLHYPVRVVATAGRDVLFGVDGSALGFVPIVITNLTSGKLGSDEGLWLRNSCADDFMLLDQEGPSTAPNAFWQTNFDRSSRTYEVIYNVEIFNDTTFAFGTNPSTWSGDWEAYCTDADSDGIFDAVDSCEKDPSNDGDGDGICDGSDSCPNDELNDGDSDSICASVDSCKNDELNDQDSDGICDGVDSCRGDANNDLDTDGVCWAADSCPDDRENDFDGDSICADVDSCPYDRANDDDSDGFCAPACGFSTCSGQQLYHCARDVCTYFNDDVRNKGAVATNGGSVVALETARDDTAPAWWRNQLGCDVQWRVCS